MNPASAGQSGCASRLAAGVSVLKPVLEPLGFTFIPSETGTASAGPLATGFFNRDYVLWAPGAPAIGFAELRPNLLAAVAAYEIDSTFECEERIVSGDLAVGTGSGSGGCFGALRARR